MKPSVNASNRAKFQTMKDKKYANKINTLFWKDLSLKFLKICTLQNRTFESDCHFLRQRCWCNKNDMKCSDPNLLNDKLDYYGACRRKISFSYNI